MLKIALSQPGLMRLGKQLGLPVRDVDAGYLVHCMLGELFGDVAPAPFDIRRNSGRWLDILAYSGTGVEELRRRADTFADPERHQAVDWDRFHQKRMPRTWPEGQTLGFNVRVCPVVRAASDTEHYSKGSEVDAFLTRCTEADDHENVPSREEVYREWFHDQIARAGGAEAMALSMHAFQLRKLTRRKQGGDRKTRVFTRPDARLEGVLRIVEADGFGDLLERGIGRHRAFGFGMMLLRPT